MIKHSINAIVKKKDYEFCDFIYTFKVETIIPMKNVPMSKNPTQKLPHDISPWSKLKFAANRHKACIEAFQEEMIDGEPLKEIYCHILDFESEIVAFNKKNSVAKISQVKRWLIILPKDKEVYNSTNDSSVKTNLTHKILHENLKSITLLDDAGNEFLKESNIVVF